MPKPLSHVQIYDWVDGIKFETVPSHVHAVMHNVPKLHRLVPSPEHSYVAQDLLASAKKFAKNFDKFDASKYLRQREVNRRIAYIEKVTKNFSWPWAVCHGDLTPLNVMIVPPTQNTTDTVNQQQFGCPAEEPRCVLIDWEDAGPNDPLFDIGKFLSMAFVRNEDVPGYLREYFGRDPKFRN